VSAHVQPARNFQGVSSAPGSAQHERSVQDVSFASGQRPQLQRLGACTESCTVQNTSLVFEQRAQRVCTQITTRAAHAHDLEAELIQVDGWDASSPKMATLWRGVKNTSTQPCGLTVQIFTQLFYQF
jgi:hypothetical protein